MAENSAIEWTDATWTIVQGCDYASPGCTNCYVPPLLHRMAHNPNQTIAAPLQGLTRIHQNGMPIFTGKVTLREDRLDWPLRWRKPKLIFIPSHGDLFHKDVPDEFIDRVFASMGACDDLGLGHLFQLLTKRAERMRAYVSSRGHKAWNSRRLGPEAWPARNVWLGVSVEDRARKARIDELRTTPAAVRFLSCEPLLEDLGDVDLTGIHQVITGGESGPRRRPVNPDWMRSLRDQCAAAGVAFFGKQIDKVIPLPPDLMVRQMPAREGV